MSKERYIAAKQKWAEKQKAKGVTAQAVASADRLPPGQKLTTGFPVLDLGVQPEIPLKDWTLTLDGMIDKPTTLSWDAFNALPQVEDVSDFHCVTTWSKYDCRWGGVAFTTLYELVAPQVGAKFVYFTSYDGYSTNVPLEQCLDDDVLVATSFDGAPVSREHGGPARIIIPKLYAWKGAKFVKAITFLAEDKLGFWEVRGYSNTADPWTEDRYA
jgi:DMSO/TMAO reductase YedYZ molybdopterin-dependent catalytic subunit|uniref:sulfite oxidase-like oxidoreductase n=1 Tax=Cephaloticoccus sp. TaxID=1985742 RepID=UPI00404A1267